MAARPALTSDPHPLRASPVYGCLSICNHLLSVTHSSLARLFPSLPGPCRLLLPSSSHVWASTGRSGPRPRWSRVRPSAGRCTARRPGLRRDVTAGDVTSPPCATPAPPGPGVAEEPSSGEHFAYRCLRDWLVLPAYTGVESSLQAPH